MFPVDAFKLKTRAREPETRDGLYEEISRLAVAIASDAPRRDFNAEPVKKAVRARDKFMFTHAVSFSHFAPGQMRLNSLPVANRRRLEARALREQPGDLHQAGARYPGRDQ